ARHRSRRRRVRHEAVQPRGAGAARERPARTRRARRARRPAAREAGGAALAAGTRVGPPPGRPLAFPTKARLAREVRGDDLRALVAQEAAGEVTQPDAVERRAQEVGPVLRAREPRGDDPPRRPAGSGSPGEVLAGEGPGDGE